MKRQFVPEDSQAHPPPHPRRRHTPLSACSDSLLALAALAAVLPAALQAQTSLKTANNIETAKQLVSTQPEGTAPLIVSSSTLVANLNADRVDGLEGTVLDTRLTNAEMLLIAVQDQVNTLGLARVPRTGQSTCYDTDGTVVRCGGGIGLGQDGDLQLGVPWPNPRFTNHGDGTVTDHLTGLIWLANANCAATVGGVEKTSKLLWVDAMTWTNALEQGHCGLTDGSQPGKWRLPNVRELQSLLHYGFASPALPNTAGTGQCDLVGAPSQCAFTDVASSNYWTSTTGFAINPPYAIWVGLGSGQVLGGSKDPSSGVTAHVWPVRGGQ